MTLSDTEAAETGSRPRAKMPWAGVATLSLLQLVLSVDTSVVNVALPRIHSALGFSTAGLSWVITAYALAFGGLVLLSGRIGAIIGPRRALLLGTAVFVAASVLGGLASSPEILVTARSPEHAAPSRRPRLADIAEIREGDASETLTGDVPDDIDFVFLDGAETLYRAITELLEPRLAGDGLIVADNADGAADYLAHVRSSGRYVSTSLDRASSCPC
jgi:hypothetical protein